MGAKRKPLKALAVAAALLAAGGCESGPSATSKDQAVHDSIMGMARTALAKRDYPNAANLFGKLYSRGALKGDDVTSYLLSLRTIRALEEARKVADKFEDDFDNDPDFLLERARLELAERNGEKALETMTEAEAVKPGHWEISSIRGVALDSLGRHAEAQAAFTEALKRSPGNAAVFNNMALSMAQQGNIDGAIDILRRLINSGGKTNPQIRQNLALMYGLRGDFEEYEALAGMDLNEDMVQRNVAAFRNMHARGAVPAFPLPGAQPLLPASSEGGGEN